MFHQGRKYNAFAKFLELQVQQQGAQGNCHNDRGYGHGQERLQLRQFQRQP